MKSKKLISLAASVALIMQLTQGMAYSAYADTVETLNDSEGTIVETSESTIVEDEITAEENTSDKGITNKTDEKLENS